MRIGCQRNGRNSINGRNVAFFRIFSQTFLCFCKDNMLFFERLSGLVEQQIKKNGFLIDRQPRGRGKERDGKKSLRPISPFPDSGGKREESILIPFFVTSLRRCKMEGFHQENDRAENVAFQFYHSSFLSRHLHSQYCRLQYLEAAAASFTLW